MAGCLLARMHCWMVESEARNVLALTRDEEGSRVVVSTFVYGQACGVADDDVGVGLMFRLLDDVVERGGES